MSPSISDADIKATASGDGAVRINSGNVQNFFGSDTRSAGSAEELALLKLVPPFVKKTYHFKAKFKTKCTTQAEIQQLLLDVSTLLNESKLGEVLQDSEIKLYCGEHEVTAMITEKTELVFVLRKLISEYTLLASKEVSFFDNFFSKAEACDLKISVKKLKQRAETLSQWYSRTKFMAANTHTTSVASSSASSSVSRGPRQRQDGGQSLIDSDKAVAGAMAHLDQAVHVERVSSDTSMMRSISEGSSVENFDPIRTVQSEYFDALEDAPPFDVVIGPAQTFLSPSASSSKEGQQQGYLSAILGSALLGAVRQLGLRR
jgi:hypothetical protein